MSQRERFGYAQEKFNSATEVLATSPDSMVERLESAWGNHLQRLFEPVMIPKELRAEFAEMQARLERVRDMSSSEQAATARLVWHLATQVRFRYYGAR
jgi:hypothetical protein